jgi:hypothetical protein
MSQGFVRLVEGGVCETAARRIAHGLLASFRYMKENVNLYRFLRDRHRQGGLTGHPLTRLHLLRHNKLGEHLLRRDHRRCDAEKTLFTVDDDRVSSLLEPLLHD